MSLRKRKGAASEADREKEVGAGSKEKVKGGAGKGETNVVTSGKDGKQQQQPPEAGAGPVPPVSKAEAGKAKAEGGTLVKDGKQQQQQQQEVAGHPASKAKKRRWCGLRWSCIDSCCWLIGYCCVTWWLLLVLYKSLPSLPQYVTEVITGPLPDPPGVRLAREGLRVKHPVVFVPGIVTGGLELWEGHPCMDNLFRKRLWGGTFGEVYKR